MRAVVVDYGLGNLKSVANALVSLGCNSDVASKPSQIEDADFLVLPGVGAFDAGMKNLKQAAFLSSLNEAVKYRGLPILGICLGMQLFAKTSSEGSGGEGLGWIDAEVVRFDDRNLDVPHIGFSRVKSLHHSSFKHFELDRHFYFVHSYYLKLHSQDCLVATADYGHELAAVVANNNIVGVQFHPEKSQANGLKFLKAFISFAEGVSQNG